MLGHPPCVGEFGCERWGPRFALRLVVAFLHVYLKRGDAGRIGELGLEAMVNCGGGEAFAGQEDLRSANM